MAKQQQLLVQQQGYNLKIGFTHNTERWEHFYGKELLHNNLLINVLVIVEIKEKEDKCQFMLERSN